MAGWAWALTGIFVVLGGIALWRWSSAVADGRADRSAGRLGDVNQVAMSVAMIAMTWWPPGLAGSVFQVVVFAVFGLLQVAGLARIEGTSARLATASETAMNAAMVWMLAAMPLLMGGGWSAAGGGHDHHGSAAAATAGTPAATPDWALSVNGAVITVLVIITAWQVIQAVRTASGRVHVAGHAGMAAGMALMLALMA